VVWGEGEELVWRSSNVIGLAHGRWATLEFWDGINERKLEDDDKVMGFERDSS
jgi:hypothetical protein